MDCSRVVLFLSFLLLLSSLVLCQPVPYCGRAPGATDNSYDIPTLNHDLASTPVLRQVQSYIRHGDRMIASGGQCWIGDEATYNCTMDDTEVPNNLPSALSAPVPRLYKIDYIENRNYFLGDCLLGQLTQQGYEQHIANGQNFRTAYIDNAKLLSPTLEPSELFLRSDDISRTIQSAESLIIGLYPLQANAETAQIVGLNTMDYGMDDMNPNTNLCPMLAEYNTLALETPASQEFNTTSTYPLFEELAPLVGVNSSADVDIWQVWDCLNVHICHNLTVPQELLDLYPTVQENMLFYANQTYEFPNQLAHAKVSSGLLVYEMMGYMQSIVNGGSDPKLIIWSSHDTSLMAFLTAFGIWNNQWTPYASTINLELYENTGTPSNWGVRIVYNGAVLLVPGCGSGEVCDYDVFNGIAQAMVPSTEECLFPNQEHQPRRKKHF